MIEDLGKFLMTKILSSSFSVIFILQTFEKNRGDNFFLKTI